MPPSIHLVGTSNKSELLKTGATTTTQTAPREVHASCCCLVITPSDVTTPAATSGLHRTWAGRDLSCLVKFAARAADDPQPLGGGQPAPTRPESLGEPASGANVVPEMGGGAPTPDENVEDAASVSPGCAVQPA